VIPEDELAAIRAAVNRGEGITHLSALRLLLEIDRLTFLWRNTPAPVGINQPGLLKNERLGLGDGHGDASSRHVANRPWFAAQDAVGYVAGPASGYAIAAQDAARFAARNAARNAIAAQDAAWPAASAAWPAALALVVRDLITPEQFDRLYGPWASVMGPARSAPEDQ
jgi:hypothetical protein